MVKTDQGAVELRVIYPAQSRFNAACPTLTRRRYPERPDCWYIYYGDVRVGTIAKRVGNPFDTDPWEWTCGFYPGSHPGECTSDTSETFDQARTAFEAGMGSVFIEANRGRLSGTA